MQEGVIFVAVSLVLAYLSRASLRKPNSHGFFRFFAWECMLGIFVLNLRFWHANTGSILQVISGFLFFISLMLVIASVIRLYHTGKLDSARNDSPMFEFEKTTHLITTGIYRYIRHPMYSSLIFLCWGLFFKHPSLPGSILAVTASSLLVVTAITEESENIRYFGHKYHEYIKQTKMFVPFIL